MEIFNKSCVSLAVLAVFQSQSACATTYNTIQGIDAGSTITNDIEVSVNNGTFTPGSSGGLPDLNVGGLYINYRNKNYTDPTIVDGKVTINVQGEYAKDNSPYWGDAFAGINVAKAQGKLPQSEVTFRKQVLINLDIDLKNNTESSLAGIKTDNRVDLTFKDQVSINLNSDTRVYGTNTVAGVYSSNNTIAFENGLDINSNIEDNSNGKAYISGIYANTSGKIKVEGLTKISGSFEGFAENSGYGAAINANCDAGNDSGIELQSVQYIGGLSNSAINIIGSPAVIKLKDDNSQYHSIIEGITHFYTGTLDLTFQQAESRYRSNIIRHNEYGTKKEISLTFANGATWYVIDEKDWVNKLNLTNGGVVVFEGIKGANKAPTEGLFQRIETDQFTSANKDNRGVINFNVDLAANKNDQLAITQQDKKSTNYLTAAINWKGADSDALYLNNALIEQNGGTLTVVNKDGNNQHYRAGGVSSWHVTFVEDGKNVDFDDADFRGDTTLNTGSGKGKWYLMKDEEKGSDLPPEVADNLVLGTSAAQAMSFAHDNKTLRHRIGEVRYGTQDGSWVRVDAQKDSFKTGFKQKTYGIMVGYDNLTARQNDSVWLLGGAFRYADSDQEALGLRQVDGKLQQYSAKLYGTWIHDQGSYADIVLQAGRFEQEMNGLDNLGTGSAKADYTTYGFGASVEVGHTFKFNQNAQTNGHWFAEPQFQLSYFYAKGQDYTTSTGLHVEQGNADFLTGRAGAVIGKKFNLGTLDDPRYFQIALTGGLNHEFLGDQNIRYVGTDKAVKSVKAKGIDGTRVYYGLTADWQCTDNLRAYAYVEREDGDGYTQEYDFNVGLKYMF